MIAENNYLLGFLKSCISKELGLWDRHTDAIIDVKLGDADTESYRFETMVGLLYQWDNINKDNHGNHLHNQLKQFSNFVLSVDGMLSREALVVLANLSQLIADKMDEPILHVQVWINGRFTFMVVRLYSCMIRVARLVSPLRDQDPDWHPASGLRLAH